MKRSGLLFGAFLVAAACIARGDPAAKLYSETCAVCHTIGQGDGAGPDLLASTRWPKEDLRVAVKRMEANTGPLTDEQIDSLVELLQAPDVMQRLAEPDAPALPLGSKDNGRALFFGERRLANGGAPCFGCHAVDARGGNLASDLTVVHTRLSPAALVSAAATPPFALMKASYARHAVTQEEALDLAAFLESPEKDEKRERVMPVRIGAVSFAGVIFVAVAFLFRSRRAGVRSRLVRDSSER